MTRPTDFDLATQLAKPSFTPGRGDAPGLVELIVAGDEPAAARAGTALVGLAAIGRAALETRFTAADEGAQARLVAVAGSLARAGDGDARAWVLERITADAVRVRRAAAVALGKLGGDDARTALVARWDAGDAPPDERRALAEALGKVGGEAAMARLHALEAGDDAELARRRDRAVLMADRSARRDEASEIATDVPPPAPLVVRLACRQGLGELLVAELALLGFAARSPTFGSAEITLAAPWSTLFASRLWVSAAIRLPLPSGDPAAAITSVLVAPSTRALLRAWTRGPIRWRLGFLHGHKRAVIWRVARDVTAAAPELVNDPTSTTWDVLATDDALELVPRRAADPRFAWRVAEIPAASHPTVAAALARVADARPDDRVWDPFCGAGAELVERARLGPYRALLGTDLDDDALAAAAKNLAAAAVTATLARADASDHAAGPVDLIITNPPLGSRVHVDAAALLERALPHFVRQLAPGGRLVWITPSPRRTTAVAESLGLRQTRRLPVDLGGVRGTLERWDRS